jgi:hypothetical protein
LCYTDQFFDSNTQLCGIENSIEPFAANKINFAEILIERKYDLTIFKNKNSVASKSASGEQRVIYILHQTVIFIIAINEYEN